MSKKRIYIISAVNAANVSKSGSTYTIRDVCGAVDDIVMNRRLYPADQLAAGVKSLNGKPAPAGHPKNSKGQHISAANGEALATAWIGAYCTNARHEAGRTLTDIVVNGDMAQATEQGKKLVERLDAAIAGTNADPIHVSTGLNLIEVVANGESHGKKYSSIATNLHYDHLAILLDEPGAGTPAEGVGMFLNSEGGEDEIESISVNLDPEDRRYEGAIGWLRSLFANKEISFDQVYDGLRTGLPQNSWIREVFTTYAIWADDAGKLWRQDYHAAESGSVAWVGQPVEVVRQVSYEPITNHQEILDYLREQITETQLSQALLDKIEGDDGALVEVEAIKNALAAMYTIKTQLTVDGKPYMAGIGVGVENNQGVITSQILLAAQRVAFLNEINGSTVAPVVVQGGQTILNDAMIGKASIGSAKFADWLESDALGPGGVPILRINFRTGTIEMNATQANGSRVVWNNRGTQAYHPNGNLAVRLGFWT